MYLYVSTEGRTKWLSDKKEKYTIKRKRAALPILPLFILYPTHFFSHYFFCSLFRFSNFSMYRRSLISFSEKTRSAIWYICIPCIAPPHSFFYYILLLGKTSLLSTHHPTSPFRYYNLNSRVESSRMFCNITAAPYLT